MADRSRPGEGAGIDWRRFDDLSFEAFRRLALDPSLSDSERIGFPDALREGAEARILESIAAALGLETGTGLVVVDIGCGCGLLARHLIDLCRERGHELVLVDSAEVLGQLPDDVNVRKVPGRFPDVASVLDSHAGRVDAVIAYSVLHYVFVEASVSEFVDAALALLNAGGALMIGDVPNVSMRKRFFSSERGTAFHREFMGTEEAPEVNFNVIDRGKIDDAILLGLVARARAQGFDAYLLPQPDDLPLANRREDILIRRP
jgi:cyclopropane fatty-acyl-phospholipid synthase-like methyltransferase